MAIGGLNKLNLGSIQEYEIGEYSFNPFYKRNFSIPNSAWENYFSIENNSTEKVATIDAMEKLNKMQNSESAKKLSAQEAEEAKQKALATKKMEKMFETLNNQEFLKFTEKHNKAFTLLNINPALSGLVNIFEQKFKDVGDAAANLNVVLLDSLSNSELTASKMNSIMEEVKNATQKLLTNSQKILSSLLKVGAYSEAMLRVDDTTKKDKYEKNARQIVAELPVIDKNLNISSLTEKAIDENLQVSEDEETENTNEVDEEIDITNLNPFGEGFDFANKEVQISEILGIQNPENQEVQPTEEQQNNISSDNETQNEEVFEKGNNDNSESEISKNEDDTEKDLAEIKKDVEEELKKQKAQKGKHSGEIYDNLGNPISSLLGLS